jgi:hypothetical protein
MPTRARHLVTAILWTLECRTFFVTLVHLFKASTLVTNHVLIWTQNSTETADAIAHNTFFFVSEEFSGSFDLGDVAWCHQLAWALSSRISLIYSRRSLTVSHSDVQEHLRDCNPEKLWWEHTTTSKQTSKDGPNGVLIALLIENLFSFCLILRCLEEVCT